MTRRGLRDALTNIPLPLQRDGLHLPRRVTHTDEAERVAKAAEAFEKARAEYGREDGLGLTKIHNLLEKGEAGALGGAYEALNDAVSACYGSPPGTWRDERRTLELLLETNHRIALRG